MVGASDRGANRRSHHSYPTKRKRHLQSAIDCKRQKGDLGNEQQSETAEQIGSESLPSAKSISQDENGASGHVEDSDMPDNVRNAELIGVYASK